MWPILPIIIPLTFTTIISSQTIQIQDLSTNPGLLTIRTKSTLVKNGHYHVYHEVDLDQYQPLLDRLQTIITALCSFPNIKDTAQMLVVKYNEITKIYQNLFPKYRNRRGAFNFLGSTLKLITGNLDQEDLDRIHSEIDQLKSNNKALNHENNVQAIINEKLQSRLNKIIQSINDQQTKIMKQIITNRQIMLDQKNYNQNFTSVIKILKISFHLDQIRYHLDSIFETIQLAKLNTVSRSFLEPEELNFIVKQLEKQNITLLNSDQAYEFLGIKVLFKNQKLYFIILIPLVESEMFNELLLETLPINNTSLKLPSNTAVVGANSTFLLKGSCQLIEQNTLCDRRDLIDVSQDECYSKILRGFSGKCVFTNHSGASVKRLTDYHIVLKNVKTATMHTDCNLSDRVLHGSFLIHFSNCTVTINGKNYSNRETYDKQTPLILPLDGLQIEKTIFETNITLEKLQELHLHNRKQMESIVKSTKIQMSSNIGLFLIIIVSAFTATVLKYCKRTKNTFHEKWCPSIEIRKTPINKIPKESPLDRIKPGRLDLQGGAVSNRLFTSNLIANDAKHLTEAVFNRPANSNPVGDEPKSSTGVAPLQSAN